ATLQVAAGGATFSGAGSISMSSTGAGSAVITGVATLTSNQLIRGFGLIGNDAIAITNNSLIDTNSNNKTLEINPNANGLTNNCTIQSTFGTIVLNGAGGGAFNNSTGTITTASATIELINGAVVSGGNLSGGTFNLKQGSSISGSTLRS